MKVHAKQVLELAALYLVVLSVVDSLLAAYPVLTWLALGIAFLVFSVFFLDLLFDLTPKKFAKPVQIQARSEDELMNLENLTKQALDSERPAASELFSKRVKSLVLRTAEYHTNLTGDELRAMVQNSALVQELFQDRQLESLVLNDDSNINPGNRGEVEELLNLAEAWLL